MQREQYEPRVFLDWSRLRLQLIVRWALWLWSVAVWSRVDVLPSWGVPGVSGEGTSLVSWLRGKEVISAGTTHSRWRVLLASVVEWWWKSSRWRVFDFLKVAGWTCSSHVLWLWIPSVWDGSFWCHLGPWLSSFWISSMPWSPGLWWALGDLQGICFGCSWWWSCRLVMSCGPSEWWTAC